jgi:hypothetical protein
MTKENCCKEIVKYKSAAIKCLCPKDLIYLQKSLNQHQVTFKKSGKLFYKNHTPFSGHLVLSSGVWLNKSRNDRFELPEGSVFGVKELLNKHPFPFSVNIEAGTKMVIIDHSTLKELVQIQNQCQNVHRIYSWIIESKT